MLCCFERRCALTTLLPFTNTNLGRRYGNPNDPDRPKPPSPTIGKVLSLAREDFGLMAIGLFALTCSSACTLSLPTLAGQVVDVVHVDADPQALKTACGQLAVIAVVGGIFSGARGYIFSVCGERLAARLRKRLFASIISQETGFFDTSRTGELINRLSSDTQVIQSALTVNISMLVRGGIQATMALGMIFYTSWKLSLIMVAIIPVIIFIASRFGKFVKRVQSDVQDALAAATEASEECMSSIRTVRSFSREDMEIERYSSKITTSYDLGVTLAKGYGGFIAVMFGISQSAIAMVLFAGGSFVISGDLTVGQLASFLLYVVFVAASLGMLTAVYGDFMKAVGASARVFDLLEREPKVNYRGGQKADQAFGAIELHDVRFSYPSREDHPVLKGLSLEVKPGSVVALVGPSGGGKSTVFSLIERFYLPTSGRITVDGIDLTTIDPQWLRSTMALVAQEPVLFDGSVKYNIGYGKGGDLTDEQMRACAADANAHEFIMGFPDGYETLVGERGVKLSGGQKQRIAIARALALSPRVLLLDEATSALDAESEHVVQEALEKAMKGRTTMVIAHRLSTVKNADVVAVIDGGCVVERGTHDQLLAQPNGVYRALVERQLEHA